MKKLIILISFFSLSSVWASDFYCSTMHQEKAFLITNDKIHFEGRDQNRDVASIKLNQTAKTDFGFSKNFYKNQLKHEVHIQNVEKLSENTDYLAITDLKGHKMTYAITCQNL